jgi:hypothetical protein
MEWYFQLALILGSLLIVGGLVWLGVKGKLKAASVKVISTITTALSTIAKAVATITENTAIDMLATITGWVNTAVLAAENAYYNNEITKDQRYDLFQKYFDKLLVAAGITLTIEQQNIIDALVRAACEELGHGMVAQKEAATPPAE